LKLRGEVEADEAYVPLGNKGKKQIKTKRRGGTGVEDTAPSGRDPSSPWLSVAPENALPG